MYTTPAWMECDGSFLHLLVYYCMQKRRNKYEHESWKEKDNIQIVYQGTTLPNLNSYGRCLCRPFTYKLYQFVNLATLDEYFAFTPDNYIPPNLRDSLLRIPADEQHSPTLGYLSRYHWRFQSYRSWPVCG
jgi:hypothetical protein